MASCGFAAGTTSCPCHPRRVFDSGATGRTRPVLRSHQSTGRVRPVAPRKPVLTSATRRIDKRFGRRPGRLLKMRLGDGPLQLRRRDNELSCHPRRVFDSGAHWSYSTSAPSRIRALVEYDQWHPVSPSSPVPPARFLLHGTFREAQGRGWARGRGGRGTNEWPRFVRGPGGPE